jgi:hypothetical protein
MFLLSLLSLARAQSPDVTVQAVAPETAYPAPLAPPPEVDLLWRRGVARVKVSPASGWHVAPEAPTRLVVRDVEVALHGDPSVLRLPLTSGTAGLDLELSTCTDDGRRCQPWTLTGAGELRGTRARIRLLPATSTPTRSTVTGQVARIVDVSARWCPPCNLLKGELLHDPADAAWRASLPPIEELDADAASAWAFKSEHRVGGYPTLIALDAENREVARLVGYPGEDATRAWFAGLATTTPAWRLREADLAALSPEQAAGAARAFAEGGDLDAARRFLARCEGAASNDAVMARLHVAPTKEDARWLAAHAPPGPWLFTALEAFPGLWDDLAPLVARLPATDIADALVQRAGALEAVGPGALEAVTARLAARAVLEAAMTGDDARDRGLVTGLADLRAATGDLNGAVTLLTSWSTAHPEDFTFDFVMSRLLLEGGRADAAIAAGERAVTRAAGSADLQLRAVQPLAKALAAAGRRDEAVARIDALLTTVLLPDDATQVRTHRYAKQVADLRATLAATTSP